MPTTRSQSKAMSTPPVSPAQEEPESPESTSSQDTLEASHLKTVPHHWIIYCHQDGYMPSPLSWDTH